MPKVELVYFSCCPHIDRARSAIRAAGIENLLEINLDKFDSKNAYHQYSSPTILLDGRIVVGSKNGGSACSLIDWEELTAVFRAELHHSL